MAGDVTAALTDPTRLAALRATDLLDTPADEDFDRLDRLAARILRAPIALVSLVDHDRLFFKSCLGLPEPWRTWRQSPLSHSFCRHVVTSGKPLVITDARSNPPSADDRAAIEELGMVAYLGVPLVVGDGSVIGSFCVIDHVPRAWPDEEVLTAQTLATSVMHEIELRRHRNRLAEMVNERTEELRRANESLRNELAERARVEEELRRAHDAARSASESKDRLLATLSHELRTPLTPVLLYASAMERQPSLAEEVRECFGLIRQQVELEARLIDDLLDATAISRGKLTARMRPTDLHDAVRAAVQALAGEIRERRVSLVVALRAGHSYVWGDPARLQQVFWNLLKNALKFSPAGSRVTIRSYDQTREEPVPNPASPANGAAAPAEWVRVEVIDEGIGLDEPSLRRIFDPFEQVARDEMRPFGGLGLGLSISKALAELHGGTLEAWSEGPQRGTTFTVRLPATAKPPPTTTPAPPAPAVAPAEPARAPRHREPVTAALSAPAAAPAAGPAAAPEARLDRPSLLVVEDHAQTARVMSKLLASRGYAVTTATSMAQAMLTLDAMNFDAIICDISLGDGSGLELMKRLRHRSNVPGIAVSGYGLPEDLARSREAGFAVHLTKPVKLEALDAALRKVLGTG